MKLKKKLSSLVLTLALVLSSCVYSNAQQNLEVHFIDVGQGDSTYIELPDGTDILVDAGISSEGSTVVEYLKSQERNIDIEYLIATHPDSDHVGGMKEVLNELNVKNFYYPGDAESYSATWNTITAMVSLRDCNMVDVQSGTTLNISGVNIKFVHPNKDYKSTNEDSLVMLIDYNDTEILLTGDAEKQTEKDMINEGLLQDIDILKVGHHGSDSSTTQEFLNKTKPENSIISVGNNSYGHPTSNVLNRLSSVGSKVWRTDFNGNIVVSTNGNTYTVKDSNGNIFDSQKDINKTEWKLINGNWYYYVNGFKKTGWVKDTGTWYYLDNNGVMQKGWIKDAGIWYYLQSNGAMKTGWLKDANAWYYLKSNGAMATGWENVNGTWYYLNENGSMATGWKQLGNTWYYLKSNGAMATGWESINNKWYYLDKSGAMVTGWKQINGTWYYMYSSGVMATNTTIDGWKIDGSGVATPIQNSNDDSSSPVQGTVYITLNGKSYHSTKNCTTLKRSTTILAVTKSEAIKRGKSDPCNICVR